MKRNWQSIMVIVVLILALGVTSGMLISDLRQAAVTDQDTGVQLASQATVICPSYLTYAQQTALEKGTGLEGVDFIYVERQTGLDAVFLMAIAWQESSLNGIPGTNSWATNYNNVMSLGITTKDPDRTHYATKTLNVLATAQWLVRGYLHTGAPYYHGGLTQWEIGQSYAWDGSWAAGVTGYIKTIEGKLAAQQRMQRWCVKIGLFQPNVVWDDTYNRIGWSFYKINSATAVAGR